MMSLGMGMTFVPLTLTAVHGVGARDSGIGSGVLNTMQQVGGALGLATLSTVAVHFTSDKVASLWAAAQAAAPAGAADPRAGAQLQTLIGQVAFTEGATHAFLTGAGMIWLGTADRAGLPQRQARGPGHRRGARGRRRSTDLARRGLRRRRARGDACRQRSQGAGAPTAGPRRPARRPG